MVTRARRAEFAYWRRACRDVIAAPRRERRPAPFGPPTNQRRRTAPPGQSVVRRREGGAPLGRSLPSSPHGGRRSGRIAARSGAGMSYKPIAPAPSASPAPGPAATAAAPSVPSPSAFRPLFNDFGPPSMGYVQAMKPPGAPGSQSTYSDLLSVIEEMGREIRPTYAGSKSAMERLKRGIIHARALVRECLAETERNART
ncbi:cyclin-dependent kinase 2-associated protein 2 [Tympanuchus pallidicinctus]|uniref:cyclin-dependent kinase 2-associated protein 2 n=1 Tax=Tympanuchus pallidicinctus TaxID=109042 RepID=UPI002286E47B|nr:cyclin-dependent kinase 2-associated protein 2 [Tympanuchus pallidicinctus]